MGIVGWIMVGVIVGVVMHALLGGGGVFGHLAAGVAGAVIGGFSFAKLHIVAQPGFGGSLITAGVGAVIFLVLWRAIWRA